MSGRGLIALALAIAANLTPVAAQEIRTPLQLVPLWTEEMLEYLVGRRQAACSGPNASASCRRLDVGVCDDTAYFRIGLSSARSEMPFRMPAKQTGSAKPQAFRLELANAGYGSGVFDYDPARLDSFALEFNCSISGNDGCPAGRFQTGTVKRVVVSLRDGARPFELTSAATVRPDGPIVVPIDDRLKAFLLEDTNRVYQLHAVTECFSVAPSPVEWTLPVYRSYGAAESSGAIIVRVVAGSGMTFAYRRPGAGEVPFEPDWAQSDSGYTFLMEQTFLDRRADWFLLPSRPFELPLWIHLPDRRNLSEVERGVVYTLSKAVAAQSKGTRRSITFPEGNIVVVGVTGRVVEFRREETFDSPCEGARLDTARNLPTYLVNVAELYDAERHLQLRPAYPKGC